jgi:hypothetical protein
MVEVLLDKFTTSSLLFVICAVLCFSISYQFIYNHFFHPLSSYPGPFLAGVTRMWIAWHNYIEDETIVCWKLVQKHGQFASSNSPKINCPLQLTRIIGPIVRFSRNLLLVAKAEHLPEIYHRRAVKTNHYNLTWIRTNTLDFPFH